MNKFKQLGIIKKISYLGVIYVEFVRDAIVEKLSKNKFICVFKEFDSYYMPPHYHDFLEFEIILEGSGSHFIGGNEYKFKKGDAWFISYSGFHSMNIEGKCRILNISFREDILDKDIADEISAFPQLCCSFDEDEVKTLENLGKKLYTESEKPNCSPKYVKTIVAFFILETLKKSEITSTVLPGFVQQAVKYIHKNYKHDISLKSAAKEISISPDYLGKLFAATLEISFSDYVNTLRFRTACDLLKSTNLSVKEIAFSSGFGSSEYFCYAFKQKFGTTPTAHRKTRKLKKYIYED